MRKGISDSEFDKQYEDDRRKWEQDIARIENEIKKRDRGQLTTLAKTGIDRKALVRLLAMAAMGEAYRELDLMRRRQSALKGLSRRLETIARDTKQVVNSPFSVSGYWDYLIGGGGVIGAECPQTLYGDDPGIPLTITGMTALAKRLRREADKMGRYLRAVGRTESGVVLLLVRCWMFRVAAPDGAQFVKKGLRAGLSLDNLNLLAFLLAEAFEAAGHRRDFTADGLRLTFKRHATRLILKWIRLTTQGRAPEATITSILQSAQMKQVDPPSLLPKVSDIPTL